MEDKNNTTKKWAVGDTCWYEEPWSGCYYECEIIEIKNNIDKKRGTITPYAKLKNKSNEGLSTFTAAFEKLVETRDELVDRNKAIENGYLAEINNKEELISFMFTHCINGMEYTDEEARSAVIKKMMEFGIDVP